jgi:uncharacterized protein
MFDLPRLWRFNRPVLASSLAERLLKHERIALYGPRQTGKTSLLREEVMPEVESQGGVAVYADCWTDREDPLASINYSLQKTLDDLSIPQKGIKRTLASTVKKIGIASASLEVADTPSRRVPTNPYLQFDALLTALMRETRKPIVLVIDEFQTLGEARDGEKAAAALRAGLTQASNRVGVVFSGSSDWQLLQLFARVKAPLYGFAATSEYPLLDAAFVRFVGQRFRASTKRTLDEIKAHEVFVKLGHQPESFLAVISYLLANPDWSVEQAEAALLSPTAANKWTALWSELTPLQKGVLLVIANDQSPGTGESLMRIAKFTGQSKVIASSVSRAIEALTQRGIVEKNATQSRSSYSIVDALMRAWLQRNESEFKTSKTSE